jgi:hypothetical protein
MVAKPGARLDIAYVIPLTTPKTYLGMDVNANHFVENLQSKARVKGRCMLARNTIEKSLVAPSDNCVGPKYRAL